MRKILLLFLITLFSLSAFSQARLVLNGAYVNLNNGSSTAPIYLVVENSNNNAITRVTGHINSASEYNFIKWNIDTFQRAYVFPFGYTTTDYVPFTYDKVDNLPVKVAFSTWPTNTLNNPHPDNVTHMNSTGDSLTSAIDRFWTMQASGPTSGLMTFSYRGTENTTVNPTTGVFSAQNWVAGNWSGQPTGGSVGVTAGVGSSILQFNTTTGQYPFVLSKWGLPLPVDLLEFTAKWKTTEKNIAKIEWKVASEKNLHYYEIQRSIDGRSFSPINKVFPKGNQNSILSYSDEDKDIQNNNIRYYYQLKIVDFDETISYSNIQVLSKTVKGNFLADVFPNPTENTFLLSINSGISSDLKIQVTDILGKRLIQNTVSIFSGEQSFKLDLTPYAKGTYLLNITKLGYSKTFKIIKN